MQGLRPPICVHAAARLLLVLFATSMVAGLLGIAVLFASRRVAGVLGTVVFLPLETWQVCWGCAMWQGGVLCWFGSLPGGSCLLVIELQV